MTDRVAGFVVTLGSDLREDDAQVVVNAVKALRGVVSVNPVRGDVALAVAESRAKLTLYQALAKTLETPWRR
jgi:hypothetical protein